MPDITYFGDVTTVGNTTLNQSLYVTKDTTVTGNVLAGPSSIISGFQGIYVQTANVSMMNVSTIQSFVGANTSGSGASIGVGGNVSVTTNLTTTNLITNTLNTTNLWTLSFTSPVGLNTAPTANLSILGNLSASSFISTGNLIASTLNAQSVNIISIPNSIGIGTVSSTANLYVSTNIYASAVTTVNVSATNSANLPLVYASNIYPVLGLSIGLNNPTPVATLDIVGNASASVDVTSPLILSTSSNVNYLNTTWLSNTLVAIGLASATANLHVQNNVFVLSALSTSNIILTQSSNSTYLNTASFSRRNVGFGTTTGIGANLHVQGNIFASNSVSTSSYVNASSSANAFISNVLYFPQLQVGLGTGSQGSNLYVQGNVNVSSSITTSNANSVVANLSTVWISQSRIFNNSIGVNTTATDSNLLVIGNIYASNSLAPLQVLALTGNFITTNVTSISLQNYKVGIQTNIGINANTHVKGNVSGSTNIWTPLIVTPSLNAYVMNTANITTPVAVGKPVPTASLDVVGNVSSANALVSSNLVLSSVANVANAVFVGSVSGPVGVNTTVSNATLTVAGPTYVTQWTRVGAQANITNWANIQTINISSISPQTKGQVGVNLKTLGGANLEVQTDIGAQKFEGNILTTTSYSLVTNTNAVYTVTGRVGVNTSASGANLEVYGNIWASNAIQTTNIYATTFNATTLNTNFIQNSQQLIGIGTNAPTANLWARGNIWASNAMYAPLIVASISANAGVLNTSWIANALVGVGTQSSLNANLTVFGNLLVANSISGTISGVNLATQNLFVDYIFPKNATSIGVGTTTGIGANLHIQGNLYASNALSGTLRAVDNLKATTLNVQSFMPINGLGIGIGTTQADANMYVLGNVYVSNSIGTVLPIGIFSVNIATLNTSFITVPVGINTSVTPTDLSVSGTMYASNSVQIQGNLIAPVMNTTNINVTSFYGQVGINTSLAKANLHIQSNTFASNAFDTVAVYATQSANAPLTNISWIAGPVGVNTTRTDSQVWVLGNIYATNALVTDRFITTVSANLLTVNATFFTGAVGIGTTTTDSTLFVNGNVFAPDMISAPNLFITYANVTEINVQSLYGANIGICNLTPVATLHVDGNIFVSNAFQVSNIITSTYNQQVVNTTSFYGSAGRVGVNTIPVTGGATVQISGNLYSTNAIQATNIFFQSANVPALNTGAVYSPLGFVGVGTSTNLGANLQILGNLYVSNAVQFAYLASSTTNVSLVNAKYIPNLLGVGLSPVGNTLDIGGNVVSISDLTVPNVTLASMNTQLINVPYFETGVGFNSTIQFPAGFYALGNVFSSNSVTTGKLAISGTANITTGSMNVANIVSPLGLVGIGITNPTANLHIQGNLYASNAIDYTNFYVATTNSQFINTSFIFAQSGQVGINTTTSLGANLHVLGNIYATNTIQVPAMTAPSLNILETNTAFIFPTNLAIGIGITNPVANLHIQGNLFASNSFQYTSFVTNSINAVSTNVSRLFGPVGVIGIGTTIPGANLHISGNVYASNGFQTPVTNVVFLNVATATNVNAIVGPKGLVGIGTTNPTANLHIQGDLYASNTIQVLSLFASIINTSYVNTISIINGTTLLGIGTSTSIGATLHVLGNTFSTNAFQTPVLIASNANLEVTNILYVTPPLVGLGITNPTANLHAQGNVFVSNSFHTQNIASGNLFTSVMNVNYIFGNAVTVGMGTSSGAVGSNLYVYGNLVSTNTYSGLPMSLVGVTINAGIINTTSITSQTATRLVGVGTSTNLGANLHVLGNIFASNTYSGVIYYQSINSTSINISTITSSTTTGVQALRIGINTGSGLGGNLHVQGNVFVSNQIDGRISFTSLNVSTMNVSFIQSNVTPLRIGVNTNASIGANLHVVGNIYTTNALETIKLFTPNANIQTLNVSRIDQLSFGVGINTTGTINGRLTVYGNVYVSNTIQFQNVSNAFYNVLSISTRGIVSNTGVGVGTSTTGLGPRLHVIGNVFGSNSFSGVNVFASLMNTSTANTSYILSSSSRVVGVGTTTSIGANLHAQGNIWASNAFQTPRAIIGTGNISTINVTSITTPAGQSFPVAGNIYTTNTFVTVPGFIATGTNSQISNLNTINLVGQIGVGTTGSFVNTSSVYNFAVGNVCTSSIAGSNGFPLYFNGQDTNGFYLGPNHPSNFNLGTSNLFVECWFFWTGSLGTFRALVGNSSQSSSGGSSSEGWVLYRENTNEVRFFVYNTAGGVTICQGTNILMSSLYTWYHVACSWDYTTQKLYVFLNGTVGSNVPTLSGTPNYSTYFQTQIGSHLSYSVPEGYMMDARIIQGAIVPTTSFTPPTFGTVFGTTSPSYAPGGTVRLALTGEPAVNFPSYLTLKIPAETASFVNFGPNHPANFNMSTSNLFGECWWWYQAAGENPNYRAIMSIGDTAGNTVFRVFYYVPNMATYVEYWNTSGTLYQSYGPSLPSQNSWTHVAWSWDYTTKRFWTFVNGGVMQNSAVLSGTIRNSPSYNVLVGAVPWIGYQTLSHIRDLRIIKGGIVPTTNFTPDYGYFSNSVPSYVTGTGAVPVMALYQENLQSSLGPSLAVSGNVYASNSFSAGLNVYTSSTQTTAIFPNKNTKGIGIGTFSNTSASLQIVGNLYATNSISTNYLMANNLFCNSISAPLTIGTVVSGMPGLSFGVYSGYMNDVVTYFDSATPTGTGTSTDFTNLSTSTAGQVAVNQANTSVQWRGYFIPSVSGTWQLTVTSDDCNYMWIGQYAISGYTATNASASAPGGHGMTAATYIASFTAGVPVPIRIQYGAGGPPNDFNFYVIPPGGSATYTGLGVYFNTSASGNLTSIFSIVGNVYVSNLPSFPGSNINFLSYSDDQTKRSIHSTPTISNSGQIQQWISAQTNVASKPVSWWSSNSLPQFGNRWRGPRGQSDYFGSVLLNDGRILFPSAKASNIGIFNWKLQEFSTVTPVGFGGNYNGAVLIPSGNVVFVSNSANVGMFNPLSLTWSNVGPVTALGSAFMGGTLVADGNVVHVPFNSANVGLFNPTTFTFSNIGPISGPSIGSFVGGVLMPNGNVVFVPYNSANIGMFDPILQRYTNIGPIAGPTAKLFSGGVLAPNGNVIFVPSTSSNVGVFNPTSSKFTNISAVSGFSGGALTPTGNVIFASLTNSNAGMFSANALTYSNVPAQAGYAGAILVPDGRIVFTPSTSTNVGVVHTITPAPPEFCLSPYFNKF